MALQLRIVHDDDARDPRKEMDNAWQLHEFPNRQYITHTETSYGWDNGLDALERCFGLDTFGYRAAEKPGGLVCELSRNSNDGTIQIISCFYFGATACKTVERMAERYGLEEIEAKLGLKTSLEDCEGLLIMSNRVLAKEFGNAGPKAREKALKLAHAEIETYNAWAKGEVYGGIVVDTETGEEVDSCYGFYGDPKKSGLLDQFEFDEVVED